MLSKRKKRRIRYIVSLILLFFALCLMLREDAAENSREETIPIASETDDIKDFSEPQNETEKEPQNETESETGKLESQRVELSPEIENETQIPELQVHFIDVGQGDCALIMCEGHTMLIDAGDNSKGTAVQLYLQKRGIERLDYVIGTHPHADHIGGLDVILTKFDCQKVLMPDCTSDAAAYQEVLYAMDYRGYQIIYPQLGDTYSLGGASFTIVAPAGTDYGEGINDYSIGIRLTYGNNSFLLVGDAEEQAEKDILKSGSNIQADVLKISHHGSHTSTSRDFLEAVSPAYAIISCGEKNDYGHPHGEVLNRLREAGIQLYRTDEQGSIIATSDGNEITFNMAPSKTWQTGE